MTRLLATAWLLTAAAALPAAEGPALDFTHDVMPVLSRFGCNGSACHGKAEGQNGFKLSVFGADPKADYEALVMQSRNRRVMVAAPDASLLLKKSVASVPHAGGRRMHEDSREYRLLRDWISSGAPYELACRPEVAKLRMEPGEKVLAFDQTQPLKVIATHADGREEDVTWLATFHSNNTALAEVNEAGLVQTGHSVGKATIMARYAGQIAMFQSITPRPGEPVQAEGQVALNAIDEHVGRNLKLLNLQSSGMADDAEFLRRVYLDVIGRLPSAAEAREFLTDSSDGKRARLVDNLLELPEYADFWALKWADLLRVDRLALGHAEAFSYYTWVHDAVAANKPLDRLASELVLAEGPLSEQPAGYFFKATKKPGEMAASLSQVFLGIRITCAECHQHPYDRWTQRDYHGMSAFFGQVKYKKIAAGEESLVTEGSPQLKHPRTKENINPYALGTAMPEKAPEGDRRAALASWMTAPENPWFARNMANRYWAHFLGRGLVEPVDDVRATNPASNPALLEELTKHLVDAKFDPKALIRFITASRTYQLSSKANEVNEKDEQNFSRALFRRMPAEVLLDAVSDVTGMPEKFESVPEGSRAVQLWDSQQQHYFLKLFGRPMRATACECERSPGASISQALHLMNSPGIQAKLSHEGGTLAHMAASDRDDAALVEDLYLSCFSRFPTDEEKRLALEHLKKPGANRRVLLEDVAWALINSLEFVFNH